MTTPAPEVGTLSRWAAGLPREEQDRLLLALANVLAAGRLGPRSRELFETLLPALAEGAEPGVRGELMHRLAAAPWAPAALFDQAAEEADEPVQLKMAQAPALPASAAATLLTRDALDVRLALAANRRVRLGADTLDALVEASRRTSGLRAPLAGRPDLSIDQAARLASWSSLAVRRALSARFGLAEAAPPAAPADSARRVVEKMGRCGRLTPDYALSALRNGRLDVFEQAMATMSGVPTEALHKANGADDPASLALVCAAVGVDRAVFPEILREVRAINGGRPLDPRAAGPAVVAALARPPAEAAEALRSSHARQAARWGAA